MASISVRFWFQRVYAFQRVARIFFKCPFGQKKEEKKKIIQVWNDMKVSK